MRPLPLAGMNVNALVSLDALLTERSVTRAAKRVRVTQPAMSQTLTRLRAWFDDPLLVRSGRGMRLSPRAEAMVGPLRDALASVERAVHLGLAFDPALSERVFRVAMTDVHAATLLPKLAAMLAKEAPFVRLEVEAMSYAGIGPRLAEGTTDLAVGFLFPESPGLHCAVLASDRFVCLVRRGHPLARKRRLTMADYRSHAHLASTKVDFVPPALASVGFGDASPAGIRVAVPFLLAQPAVVRATQLVATVPRALLDAVGDTTGLVVLDAPEEFPPVVHAMAWNARYDRDPAHTFLREAATRAFGGRRA